MKWEKKKIRMLLEFELNGKGVFYSLIKSESVFFVDRNLFQISFYSMRSIIVIPFDIEIALLKIVQTSRSFNR